MSWKISTRGIPQSITGVAPTLDYRFAIDRNEIDAISLTDKLTYTGGNGTFVGSDGFIQRAATNVPRFDHDPLSRRSLGLLSEAERTNSIRNSTMVGAVTGTPGTLPTNWSVAAAAGLTTDVAAIGVSNGISYIDLRISGTSTSTSYILTVEAVTQTAALSGQIWTLSAWFSIISGNLNNINTIAADFRENNSGGTQVAAGLVSYQNPTSSFTRQSATRTLSEATTASLQPRIRLSITNSAAIDLTLRIGLPQLELGATASTPIPTTSAAVTRTADSAVIDGTGVITGTYTMVEKPAGCAVVSGTNINLQPGFTAERVMVFPAALDAGQITAIRGAM
jgi:hypothetical protein